MYTTCIHCNTDLGRNEAFETFPVGTRLAFDAKHGRLLVVCRRCARWYLSPLDERWETIEEAERRFRDSRLRVSTDNVGLARLREGVDLIRIGEAQRPEMAAWRYGDQFGKRRSRQMLITGAVVGTAVTLAGGIIYIGASVGSLAGVWGNAGIRDVLVHGLPSTIIGRIPLPDGQLVRVRRTHARNSVIERTVDSEEFVLSFDSIEGKHVLRGEDAMRVAARLMPTVNRFGGSAKQVADAVGFLDEIGDPVRVLRTLQQRFGGSHDANKSVNRWKRSMSNVQPQDRGALKSFAPRDRLALEMALHEESERRAMDGELAALEAAWREAEEIANIADNMFVLLSVDAKLAAMKRQSGASTDGARATAKDSGDESTHETKLRLDMSAD